MQIDLSSLIRAGDSILWGQGCGEPLTLTEALVNQRETLGGVSVFLGASFSDTVKPEHADHIRFTGIGGIGRNAALARAGALDVLPIHVSTIPALLASGALPVDVVLVQVSQAGPEGLHSCGLVGDYVRAAMRKARVVVAEINAQVPYVLGTEAVRIDHMDAVIHSDRPPLSLPDPSPNTVGTTIGQLVAGLVPDRAIIQLGVGSVPAAVGMALAGHRDLGVHAGVVGDWLVDLVEAGAVTNAYKAVDPGVSVTGALFGTKRLYSFAHRNPSLNLRPLVYTHARDVLARLSPLYAVNSAIEVDLTGQVNAETLDGTHIGAVGGQVDFVRAALSSPQGRSIIALPSTARSGQRSRIVPGLTDSVVTTCRSDADLVVTEFGVADLRGASLWQRAERLIAIAHPEYRESLRRAAFGSRGLC